MANSFSSIFLGLGFIMSDALRASKLLVFSNILLKSPCVITPAKTRSFETAVAPKRFEEIYTMIDFIEELMSTCGFAFCELMSETFK